MRILHLHSIFPLYFRFSDYNILYTYIYIIEQNINMLKIKSTNKIYEFYEKLHFESTPIDQ